MEINIGNNMGIDIGNNCLGINIGNSFLRINIGNGRVSLGVRGRVSLCVRGRQLLSTGDLYRGLLCFFVFDFLF